jgi:hypothetical protein
VVEIDGASAGDNVDGLNFGGGGDGSTVNGLSIINFNGTGTSDGGAGIRGDALLDVEGCHLGVRADGSTVAPNDRGLVLTGSNNTIGGFSAESNIIGGNDLQGILVEGSDNAITGDLIGLSPSGDDLGNGSGASGSAEGIRLTGDGNELARNTVAFNAGAGITVVAGATDNDINENVTFSNGGLGIDLGDDGRTANDAGDGDDGNNRLQNYPEIRNAQFTSTGDIEVTYLVPSDPNAGGSGASTYPLRIEVYKASADGEGGRVSLESDTYSAGNGGRNDDYGGCGAPPCPVTFTFTPSRFVDVSRSDKLVATATDGDGNGNTSEFSPVSSPLPVELASFKGSVVEAGEVGGSAGAAVRLTWQTASETGNAGFEVQRRAETGSSWKRVGYRPSRADGGTTTEAQTYRFTDDEVPYAADTLRYRLRQVDLDGTASTTDPITVARPGPRELRLLGTAPNPARERVSVRYALPAATVQEGDARLRLYDVLGRRVRSVETAPEAGRHERRLDVSHLPSGVYFLRLAAGGQTVTRKLTVVR